MTQNKGTQKKVVKRGRGKMALGAILALLLLGGGGYGIGRGTGLIGSGSSAPASGDDASKAPSAAVEQAGESDKTDDKLPADAGNAHKVVVSEKTITLDGEEVTIDALRDALLHKEDADSFSVKGDKAVKDTLDEVKAVFEDCDVEYTLN